MLSRVASGFRSVASRMSIRKNFGNFDVNPMRTGVCRGKDEYGNTYWEDVNHSKTGSGSTTRWIMPADVKRYDASSIPPGWYGWLHSITDHPPQEDTLFKTQPWVERREPLTLSHMGAVGESMPPGYLSHQMDCKPDHKHSHIEHMRMGMGDPVPEPKYSPEVEEMINANIEHEPDIPDPVMEQRQPYLANPNEASHHGRNIVGRMIGQDHYVPWVGAHYEKDPVKII